MRRFAIVCGFTLAALPAYAAEPTGEWAVANGHAHVRIENCGAALWGAISWEEKPGGRDTENPDPDKRNRPTLGMPILLNMAQTEANRWEGDVYNAENGRTYSASISLVDPNTLHIEGCVLGFLCGGENWSRVPADENQSAQAGGARQPGAARTNGSARSTRPAPRGTTGAGRSADTGSTAQPIDVCSRVSDVSGRPH